MAGPTLMNRLGGAICWVVAAASLVTGGGCTFGAEVEGQGEVAPTGQAVGTGKTDGTNSYNYAGALQFPGQTAPFCSGVLITPVWVATANHCITGSESGVSACLGTRHSIDRAGRRNQRAAPRHVRLQPDGGRHGAVHPSESESKVRHRAPPCREDEQRSRLVSRLRARGRPCAAEAGGSCASDHRGAETPSRDLGYAGVPRIGRRVLRVARGLRQQDALAHWHGRQPGTQLCLRGRVQVRGSPLQEHLARSTLGALQFCVVHRWSGWRQRRSALPGVDGATVRSTCDARGVLRRGLAVWLHPDCVARGRIQRGCA
ncbi:MAG: trypsin-like serine protease [Phycisphaerales bacterium]|nr:trypsin-like serine protease [Phycisphaerales bacterium]